MLAVPAAPFANPQTSVAEARNTRIATAGQDANSRLNPILLERATETPDASIMVHAYVLEGTDLSQYMPDALTRNWVSPDGITITTGTIRARNLNKLAGVPGVLSVDPMTGAFMPSSMPQSELQAAPEPSAELLAHMSARIQSGDRNNTPGGAVAGTPTGWYDVDNTHHSADAWDLGYTGAGVKVMSNDSGIDFTHPDLIGTWATVEDPASPYAGWPMQFDAFSMFLHARDVILGESNIANGNGQYADTSTTITESNSSYQPLDSDEPYDYTLTGTSLSGSYHIGTHPDTSLRPWYFIATGQEQSDGDPGQRPAVLVVDENTPGWYDTVYVDLDFDSDFTDEKPMTKSDPISGADWWGAYDPETGEYDPEPDGFYDISSGLIYWISDGVNPVPAANWWWGFGIVGNGEKDMGEASNGNLVLFSILDYARSPGGNHGQLVASAIAAQGIIDGDSMERTLEDPGSLNWQTGGVRPDYKPEGSGGMVQAAGKDVKLVSAGDFYSYGAADAFLFAALGYDGFPATIDDIQIINNSWGSSATHNDGWDGASRVIDALTRPVNPTMLTIFSVGNGSPGFGTVAPPSPPSALGVGASTSHGSTGWDDAAGADQITYGDVASFSGRGPSARGTAGVDITGSGSRASGDVPVNEAKSGWHAWTTWGGTSRSAPVVAGNAALVYQAFMETYGFWPNYEIAKMLLVNGATDLKNDPFLQGAGSVNALSSVELATGKGGFLTYPFEWNPGDYHGIEWPGFANIVHPGGSYDEHFQFSNPTNQTVHLSITDQWMQKTGTHEFDWISSSIDDEPITLAENPVDTEYEWDVPHYLWNVTDLIPEGTDMVVMRFNYPWSEFDPDFSYQSDQTNSWYLTSYDWTDIDGDGQLWTDTNGNGVIDGDEIDRGEYVRFEYSNQRATTHYISVGDPHERMHDGLFLGMQHSQARADIPVTNFTIGLDFYQRVDMPWITVTDQGMTSVSPLSTNRVKVKLEVPGDAPIGIYAASLLVSDGYRDTIVPVVINVSSKDLNVTAGTEMYRDFNSQSYYNNEIVWGAQSWRWRQESGDWRFYFTDLPPQPGLFESKMPDGSYFYLAEASWESELSDIDIHVMSPIVDQFNALDPNFYGPYTLAISSSSNNAYVGSGTYRLDTSSGRNHEIIAAPYIPGLNGIALHNTNFSGDQPSEQVELRTGVLGVSQAPMEVTTKAGSSQPHQQSVMSSIPLSGLEIQGFGLSTPDIRTAVPIQQDDPNDPSTSSHTQVITLENAGLLDIQIAGGENDDIDLFLIQDLNSDGEYDFATEQIAASTTPTSEERITIQLPDDGNYLIAVHGWAIPPEGSVFDIGTLAVQGDGIQTSGAPEGSISPYRTYNFSVEFDTAGLTPGPYTGLVTIGPPEGPSAVLLFANVTIE
ncbi:hypothetical protein BH23CHL2_BH23CHL2_29620 [soil metagenome]